MAEVQRRRREHDLRRVIERPDREVHAVAGLEVEHQREERHRGAGVVRVSVRHLARTPFGFPVVPDVYIIAWPA